MKKKYRVFSFIAIIVMVISIGVGFLYRKTEVPYDVNVLSSLSLDQKESYVGISANDDSGYNRWIAFYFRFNPREKIGIDNIDPLIDRSLVLSSIRLDDGSVVKTRNIICSSGKHADSGYTLTLVLDLGVNEMSFSGVRRVLSITVYSQSGESRTYTLPKYLLEQRNTLPEDIASVSLSTVTSELSSKKTAIVNYGISSDAHRIDDIMLSHADNFNGVQSYEITDSKNKKNGKEFSVKLHLPNKSDGVIYRPFLKIAYDAGESGFVMPSVPVYIE